MLVKQIGQDLKTYGLLETADKVVVGVSGGPDSMALLHVLLALNQGLGWRLELHIAHLNHLLRADDAQADAAFVQAAADSLDLPCTIEQRDIRRLAKEASQGVEETGRKERYEFFERICLRTGADVIALGHHADDNAETILHRILRGTGLRGLAGIPQDRRLNRTSRIRIIRPLLRVKQKTLLDYLADAGIAFQQDRSNLSTEPMRNRIRHDVLPLIEQHVNPQVRDALVRLGELAQWHEEYLRETAQRTFETLIISRTDQQLVLNADAMARKGRIVQTELVRFAYTAFGLGEQALGFANLVSVLDLIDDPTSGRQAQLPGGMTVEKRYHQLIFSLPSDEPREEIAAEIAIHVPGRTRLPIRRLDIECTIEQVEPNEIHKLRHAGGRLEEFVDFQSVHLPLVVRHRRPGERFYPLGAPGSKKLADYLIDAKVDPKEREKVAVLCDRFGPIWIIGHRIDDRVKLTSLSRRVLHLRARPLDP